MNLEYAAYLLNEDHFLTEDANSSGQNGALQWLQQNYPMEEFGVSGNDLAYNDDGTPMTVAGRRAGEAIHATNALRIERRAEEFFARPLNRGLDGWAKGLYKFLPGVVRIAVTECGWLTKKENLSKIERLKDLYIAAYYEWRDGIEEGRQSNGGQYQGIVNKDFVKNNQLGQPVGEPLNFNELNALLGDRVQAAKERLEAQAAHGVQAIEEPQESEEERAAREEAERIRRSTAGEYHIEYIPNYTESKKWYKYTNPLSDAAGCHWCITQSQGYWNDYQGTWGGGSVYFCWKAESKEALLAMNDGSQWFEDWPSDRDDEAPKNEYGLSLICIMVSPDDSGVPRFRQATSRYNHRTPHNYSGGSLYGDNLVRHATGRNDKNEQGLREICQILGITVNEFNEKFPLQSSNTECDHTEIVNLLNTSNLPEKKLFELLRDKYVEFNESQLESRSIISIEHQGEFNFINRTGKLLFPNQWFISADPLGEYRKINDVKSSFFDTYVYKVRIKDGNRITCNIINEYGEFVLEQNVFDIVGSQVGNYVKFIVNDEKHLVNAVNIKTKNILLRKPVYDMILTANLGKSIAVKETEDDDFILVDLKGKKIGSLPFKRQIPGDRIDRIKSNRYIPGITENNKFCIYDKTNGKKVLTISNPYNGINCITYITNDYFIIRYGDNYKIYAPNGSVLLDNVRDINISYLRPDNNYIMLYKEGRWNLYDVKNSFNKVATNIIQSSKTTFKSLYIAQDKLYDSGELVCDLYSNEFSKIVDGNNVVVILDRNKYALYNIPRKEFVIKNLKSNNVYYYGYFYYTLEVVGNAYNVTIYDEDFNIINNTIRAKNLSPLSNGFVLYEVPEPIGDNKYNFITPAGKAMFKVPFKSVLSSFNDNGVATIEAGSNIYYVNIYGDVSRSMEEINESTYQRIGYPILNETKRKSKKINTLLENAAYLL